MRGSDKGHRSDEFLAPVRRDEIRARATVAGAFTVDFAANGCPTARTIALAFKAGFIHIDDIAAASLLYSLPQATQIRYALFIIPFTVAQCFFYGLYASA